MKKTYDNLVQEMSEYSAEGFLIQDLIKAIEVLTIDYIDASCDEAHIHLKKALESLKEARVHINEADSCEDFSEADYEGYLERKECEFKNRG